MKLSGKSPKHLSLILAVLFVTTASIVLANQSGRPTREPQGNGRDTAHTLTTNQRNGFVDNSLPRLTSPVASPTASPTPAPSRIYRVVEVKPATGFPRFTPSARGLGEHGELLGSMTAAQGPLSAAIWRNGVLQEIPTSNALNSVALDINESNQVVGRAYFEPADPQGVRREHDVAYILPDTPLPKPVGVVDPDANPLIDSQFAEASANNNVGQVIGYSKTNPTPFGIEALLWDTTIPGNPFRILDPLPGDSESRPFDINDNGTVVGESGNHLLYNGDRRAVVWKNDRAIDIGNPPGFNRCQATRINSIEFVVVLCENTVESLREVFIWYDDNANGESDPGELRVLQPPLPDSSWNYLCDINDQGQLTAGKFIYSDDNSNGLPDFGEKEDLNSLIIDTSYSVGITHAINNRGQILAFGNKRGAPGVPSYNLYMLLDPHPQPVIFIPGIGGSDLFDHPRGNAEKLWLAPRADRLRLSLFPSDNPSPAIDATDAMRYAITSPTNLQPTYAPLFDYLTTEGKFREYQVNGFPFRRVIAGCDLTQKNEDHHLNPNFFVFAYDWRKSNIENAAKLKDYVGCVKQFHPESKINLLAHSMGGLISRRYILDNPNDHEVDRLITIGTPWLGAPKLLHVLETGEFIKFGPINIAAGPKIKYIAPSLIAAHQLVPSRAYQELGGPPIFVKRGWDYDETGEPEASYDYDRVLQFLDKRYPESMPGTVGPGTTGDQFHSYSTALGKQDDWRTDSTGVNYFHFYGVQSEDETIAQLVAKYEIRCRSAAFPLPSAVICYYGKVLKRIKTAGDGTVPEISASRKTSTLDFNAPNARIFKVTNNKQSMAEHVGMLHNPEVQEAVLTLLRGGTVSPSISSAVPRNSAQRTLANHARADNSASTPFYYISIIGASSVVVADAQGNSTAPVEGDLLGSVPDVDIFFMAENARSIDLPVPNAEQYTISFTAIDEPLAVRIAKGESEDRPTDVIFYQDIVLPAGVPAKLVLSPTGVENLRYDSDGNGSYDVSVSPTIVLTGTAALDVTDPTLAFAESQQDPTVTLVTITAADSGTGIRDVYYSTDGVHFQAYTTAVALDRTQTRFISAFATDNAGNRSPISSYPADRDNDRVSDASDNCPVTANSDQLDTDNDVQGDACDLDDDGDEAIDSEDAFPLDASESVDTDLDGVGNNADRDDDGDRVLDAIDNCPWHRNPNQLDEDRDFMGNVCDSINNPAVHLIFLFGAEIYVKKSDGRDEKLTSNAFDPALSPDKARVAFSKGSQIYSMTISDKRETQLTNASASNRHPAWSPDGSRIAFTSSRPCELSGRIISDRAIRIFSMNAADGSDVKCLSDQIGFEPTWSPNGRKIAFTGLSASRFIIFSMNSDGSGLQPLTDNSSNPGSPTWSPDGSRIAFVSNSQIYLMKANGGPATRWATIFSVSEVVWGSNNKIAYSADVYGYPIIYRKNIDGTQLRSPSALRTPFPGRSPRW